MSQLITLPLRVVAGWQLGKILEPPVLGATCIARLPSLQRAAIWKPDQVELLWDSLFRSFPIGIFVISSPLHSQQTRPGAYAEDDWVPDAASVTHHLLDGQQRANAITLGFYDPFDPRVLAHEHAKRSPVLWLDLNYEWATVGGAATSTRSFLFRLTTEAHPWGYNRSDEAKPVSHQRMRDALTEYGSEDRRPMPFEAWPIDAKTPVPVAWLLQEGAASGDNQEGFWTRVTERCARTSRLWSLRATTFLRESGTHGHLTEIFQGVRAALNAKVVLTEVPAHALGAPTRQQTGGITWHGERISNVEHLFRRLNAGGTAPTAEDLAYSMIKTYWPEFEPRVSSLSVRRMPESRLAMLGMRIATAKLPTQLEVEGESARQCIPDAISNSRIRGLAYAESEMDKRERDRIKAFFMQTADVSLERVLNKISCWLDQRDPGDWGVPSVIHTSIARNSPDVYLLLMWLASAWLSARGDERLTDKEQVALRKRVIGLTTSLHWFGDKINLAVRELVNNRFYQAKWPDFETAFESCCRAVFDLGEGRIGLFPLPTPEELSQRITEFDEQHLAQWRWWNLVEKDDAGQRLLWPFLDRLLYRRAGREMLLYAQRNFIWSFDYDPSRLDRWEDHNRPWDFDHILPRSKVNYSGSAYRDTLMQWVDCLADLRAWRMEDNRSEQAICPMEKIADPEARAASFIDDDLCLAFDQGCRDVHGSASVLAFIEAAKRRLIRIYADWFKTLEICKLTR